MLICTSRARDKANVLFRTFSNDAASLDAEEIRIMLKTIVTMAIELIPFISEVDDDIINYLKELRPGIDRVVEEAFEMLMETEDSLFLSEFVERVCENDELMNLTSSTGIRSVCLRMANGEKVFVSYCN